MRSASSVKTFSWPEMPTNSFIRAGLIAMSQTSLWFSPRVHSREEERIYFRMCHAGDGLDCSAQDNRYARADEETYGFRRNRPASTLFSPFHAVWQRLGRTQCTRVPFRAQAKEDIAEITVALSGADCNGIAARNTTERQCAGSGRKRGGVAWPMGEKKAAKATADSPARAEYVDSARVVKRLKV